MSASHALLASGVIFTTGFAVGLWVEGHATRSREARRERDRFERDHGRFPR